MDWAGIPDRDRERLLAIHQNKDEAALIWEAERYGMKYLTLKRRLQELNAKQVNPNDTRHNWVDHLRITTDDMVFISDIEIPDQHEELMEYAKQIGKIYAIHDCMWVGDLTHSDEFSSWPVTWQDTEAGSYTASLRTLRHYFTDFKEVYSNQHVTPGNHDDRFAKAVGGALWLGDLFDIPGVTFNRYPFALINTCRGLVRVTHPQNFSENAIGLGQKLYAKLPIPSHLVIAHTHQNQRGWSKNGVHEIIVLGCMRDPNKTHYKSIVDNTYGEWNPGFAMMKNGYFYQFGLFSTDWKSVLKGNLIG